MKSVGLIPLRKFSGLLKRVRIDENESMAMLILDLAFPHFRNIDPSNEKLRRIYTYFYGKAQAKRLTSKNPRRRFSGGQLTSTVLPRGRYYSICNEDLSGDPNKAPQLNDHGVIQHEMLAYADWRVAGPVMIFDWQNEKDNLILKNLGHFESNVIGNAFCVAFFRTPGKRNIIDVIFHEKDQDPNFKNDEYGGAVTMLRLAGNPFSFLSESERNCMLVNCFNIHYRFDSVQLENVVDLRYPDTQEAFVRTFCPSLANAHREVGPIGAFLEMLPTLLSSDLGGCYATDVIGSYLRSLGVDALIYPSARCNGYVQFHGDQLFNFKGWCLVDYRGASNEVMPTFSDELFIPTSGRLHVEVPSVSAEYGYGSWKIRGIMERGWQRFQNEVKEYCRESNTGL